MTGDKPVVVVGLEAPGLCTATGRRRPPWRTWPTNRHLHRLRRSTRRQWLLRPSVASGQRLRRRSLRCRWGRALWLRQPARRMARAARPETGYRCRRRHTRCRSCRSRAQQQLAQWRCPLLRSNLPWDRTPEHACWLGCQSPAVPAAPAPLALALRAVMCGRCRTRMARGPGAGSCRPD